MSAFKLFDVAGSAMAAQSLRLSLTASNLANAESVSSSINQTYRSRQPVFAAELKQALGQGDEAQDLYGVRVAGVVESQAPLRMEYAPEHPLANDQGYIFKPNVNSIEEMTNMLSASRSYQDNAEVIKTVKELLRQTLQLGQS